MCLSCEQSFKGAESPVCGQSQQRGRNCSRQDQAAINRGYSTEYEHAESPGADRRSNCCNADADNRRNADSRKNDRQRFRKQEIMIRTRQIR